jgi:hypothetical protein
MIYISVSYDGPDTVVYSAAGLPPGLVMNPDSGAITGTPTSGDSALGSPPSGGGLWGAFTR